ncbi:hypothetical protein [Falsiroseomonas tokyonensis]|uniref:Transposase n=1 Tax=Falsiroseomonas tokyonensis TaxID=430521 RepID=A0ABV7C0N2_9PROT|nr:hypothetical protein [Falsiroseomonas tokyonensis]MBU8541443.1 hypothetical protein [Falsiroseomonas tokyonensis]
MDLGIARFRASVLRLLRQDVPAIGPAWHRATGRHAEVDDVPACQDGFEWGRRPKGAQRGRAETLSRLSMNRWLRRVEGRTLTLISM